VWTFRGNQIVSIFSLVHPLQVCLRDRAHCLEITIEQNRAQLRESALHELSSKSLRSGRCSLVSKSRDYFSSGERKYPFTPLGLK